MTVTSNLIQTPKVVTIDQNRWSRSVTFTGHDLLEWVVTVDQNTHYGPRDYFWARGVKADVTTPVNCALKRIEPGQKAAKEPQC
jgi:hypothetical protein